MLDIQLRKLLDGAREAGLPDLADLPPPGSRALYSRMLANSDLPVAQVDIEDRTISGPGGRLPLRIYRPRGGAAPRGAVLYLHGGGFVVGRPQDYDGVVSVLAERSGCVVVQADYRLAPEHPFPAGVEDSYAALLWLAEHAAELGADPARIAVAGDSAGANLAAVCAILARDRGGPTLVQQTLVYPVTAAQPGLFESHRRYAEGYTLTAKAVRYFDELYLGGKRPVGDFRSAPLVAEDLRGLPPALVVLARYDPLRDEGEAFAEALAGAGNDVTLVEYASLAHGFMSMGGILPAARLAVWQVADALGQALAPAQVPAGAPA